MSFNETDFKNVLFDIKSGVRTFVDFSNEELGDRRVEILVETLKNNQSVTSLNLFSSHLTAHGVKSVINVLKDNSSIKELYIGQNLMGGNYLFDETGPGGILADTLANNTTLTRLSLNNLFYYPGRHKMQGLTHALQKSTSLRFFDFSQTGMDLVQSEIFANFLKHNTTLTEIDLSDNDIREESAKFLLDALKSNSTLTAMTLDNNDFTEKTRAEIALLLDRNRLVQVLSSSVIEQFESINETTTLKQLDTLLASLKDAKLRLGLDDNLKKYIQYQKIEVAIKLVEAIAEITLLTSEQIQHETIDLESLEIASQKLGEVRSEHPYFDVAQDGLIRLALSARGSKIQPNETSIQRRERLNHIELILSKVDDGNKNKLELLAHSDRLKQQENLLNHSVDKVNSTTREDRTIIQEKSDEKNQKIMEYPVLFAYRFHSNKHAVEVNTGLLEHKIDQADDKKLLNNMPKL